MAGANDKNVRLRHAFVPTNFFDVNERLTNDQLTYLKTTPFHWVSKLPKKMMISSVLFGELVKRWNEGGRGFNVRGMVVPFTPADVCLTLGLLATGDPVVGAEDDQCYKMSMFELGEVTIEDILNKLVVVKDNVGDFARTYILLAFGEFYFPRTGRLVFTDYVWLLDDLEATNNFNWARAVYDYLINSLRKAVAAIDSGTNEHQIHLCGCAAILHIWAMNQLSIGETPATPPKHPFPRILNWPIVALRNKKMKEAFQNTRQQMLSFRKILSGMHCSWANNTDMYMLMNMRKCWQSLGSMKRSIGSMNRRLRL